VTKRERERTEKEEICRVKGLSRRESGKITAI